MAGTDLIQIGGGRNRTRTCDSIHRVYKHMVSSKVRPLGTSLTSMNVLTFVLTSRMASLWKHPKSRYWYACFQLPNGKRTKRSTKEINRKKAQAIADSWEGVARGNTTAIQARKVVSDIFKASTGETLSHSSIREFFADWLKSKKPEIGKVTAQKYGAAVSEFMEFLGEKAETDLLRLTHDDLHAFRDFAAEKSSPKTANNKLTIVSQAARMAYRDGHMPDNIAGRTRKLRLKGRQQVRQPFKVDQIRAILNEADGEWKGIVLMGYYTGQRLGDIATLRWRDIDLKSRMLSMVSKKQQRRTNVPLVGPIFDWLSEQKSKEEKDPHVFPLAAKSVAKNDGKVSALSKQFQVILVSVGLAKRREWKSQEKGRGSRRTLSPLTFHSLRHSLTSDLKDLGSGSAIAQDIVGHDSTAASNIYTHVSDDAKRQYLEKLPDITKNLS